MMRQCVPDADLAELTREGADFCAILPSDWPEPVELQAKRFAFAWAAAHHGTSSSKMAKPAASVGIDVELWTPEQANTTGSGARRGGVRRRALVRQRRHHRHPCFVVGLSKVRGDQQGAQIRYNAKVRSLRDALRNESKSSPTMKRFVPRRWSMRAARGPTSLAKWPARESCRCGHAGAIFSFRRRSIG